jgi:hypothetical protein
MSVNPPLLSNHYLESILNEEYQKYLNSDRDGVVIQLLKDWDSREFQNETSSENAFVDVFFKRLWGYSAAGEGQSGEGYTCYSQFPVGGAGQGGGTGKADLALGHFGVDEIISSIPQALCEFKDIRSDLDANQNRKGNTRTPVKQCADYLKEAYSALFGNEPVLPVWGIVTDMNEFRIYYRKDMPSRFQRFVISKQSPSHTELIPLLGDQEEARFQRFIFSMIFRPEFLITKTGKSRLEKLLDQQLILEEELEKSFYEEYQAYRVRIFNTLAKYNPAFSDRKGRLVRLAQRLLDRLIFILYCEDMGASLNYPRDLLRDFLIKHSLDEFYDPEDDVIWSRIKKLFAVMNDGGKFLDHKIDRFNGGLFEHDPDLDSLKIPAFIFCSNKQGSNQDEILRHPETLLYFSGKYNFGITRGHEGRSITLYALGRIFEQSITELEAMEAEAEGRISLTVISKRKRNGVYYTPEKITDYIVRETIGARLEDIKKEIKLDAIPTLTDEQIVKLQKQKGKGKKHDYGKVYLSRLEEYAKKISDLKIIDPACGSGAFLVQAVQFLLDERRWISRERERITGHADIFHQDAAIRDILAKNIYGVDVNSESVEIARLAVWLHTVRPGTPLTDLDHNIVCGNTLVAPDFYTDFLQMAGEQPGLFTEDLKDRINVFDWKSAFPAVFEEGGFDCVIGNPPYVKLQNFRRVDEKVAEYLVNHKLKRGPKNELAPRFESAQTGNFDLYLPFIEKGIELMKPDGRMGYIAPSLWTVNDYGAGLRALLLKNRHLERWVDFRDYQVFEEAITYTALQFYTKKPQRKIRLSFAPDGELGSIEWDRRKIDSVEYTELEGRETWNFMPDGERSLFEKLNANCKRLDEVSESIIVGIQTSADSIYHLTKRGPGIYIQHVKEGKGSTEVEVAIEEDLMKPLVSGPEAKRYIQPVTDTYLLFPYNLSGGTPILYSDKEMAARFPKGWAYLKSHEKELRGREMGKFDDPEWYRFGRNQNIDKQERIKLGVAQTVPGMRVFFDYKGEYYFNNVRVNGILPADEKTGWYLLGILNSLPADFVFRRLGKPKEGGYYEANKQFIAPLPIPEASQKERESVISNAKALQELHSQRRDRILEMERRFESPHVKRVKRKPEWLLGKTNISECAERIRPLVRPGTGYSALYEKGAVTISLGGRPVIGDLFLDDTEGPWIAAYWNYLGRTKGITASVTAEKFLLSLLDIPETESAAIRNQVIDLEESLQGVDKEIALKEKDINKIIYNLYGLTEEEILMVKRG